MTNKERLFAAFNNQPVDRVPVGFWFHFLGEDQMDDALENPLLAKDNVAGHRKFIESFHPDFVKVMSDGYFHYPIGKGETYSTPDDLAKITLLAEDHPWIAGQVELVRQVVALQPNTAYFYNIFSPIGNLQWLIGAETFYRFFREDPDKVKAALDIISVGLGILAKALIRQGGADGIYFSVSNPDASRISDAEYVDYIKPGELYFLEEIAKVSENHILHICGFKGKRNNLSLFRDYPAKAVNWAVNVEEVSLSQGRKLFDGRAVIGGFANPAGSLIHTGSEGDIKAFARTILEEAGTTGVIVGADCTIPSDTDLAHLEWVREAVRAQYAAAV